MNQVLLYSINAEHLLNILNGNKTIEVRKRDLPQWAKDKLDRGEAVQGYGYCTKGKPYLLPRTEIEYITTNFKEAKRDQYSLNGLVVVKFEVSGSDKIYDYHIVDGTVRVSSVYETDNLLQDELLDKACLTLNQISNYVGMNDSYAHHFTNIQPIEPMELSEFVSDKLIVSSCGNESRCWSDTANYFARKNQRLTKAPQSFQTVWLKGA